MAKIFKIIINIIFYIIYVLVFSLLFGMLVGVALNYYGKTIIEEPMASYIQIILMFFVLFVTLIFRKTFYLSLDEKRINYSIETVIYKNSTENTRKEIIEI